MHLYFELLSLDYSPDYWQRLAKVEEALLETYILTMFKCDCHLGGNKLQLLLSDTHVSLMKA